VQLARRNGYGLRLNPPTCVDGSAALERERAELGTVPYYVSDEARH
jgi:hypothetical protein